MRPGSSVVALAVGLLPSVRAVAGAIPWLETCSVNAVLEYFTCQTPVPEGCIDNLAEQATAWCSSYLSIKAVTVHLSTETPVLTETVVETSTTISTSIEVVITTVETTSTTTATEVAYETVTATITTGGAQRRLVSTPVASATSSCVDLAKKGLLRHPASRLSKACSCLDPQPTTVTVGATTAAPSTTTTTETTVVTVVVPETGVSTEVVTTVVTEAATVTSTSTATVSVARPKPTNNCETVLRYGMINNGMGNKITIEPLAGGQPGQGPLACCEQCHATPNCLASMLVGQSRCQFLIKTVPLAGAQTSEQCPFGVEKNLAYAAPMANGPIFSGPCGNLWDH